jgi:hypothetical protein
MQTFTYRLDYHRIADLADQERFTPLFVEKKIVAFAEEHSQRCNAGSA